MTRPTATTFLLALLAAALYAQETAKPEFDAASVKPSEHPELTPDGIGPRGGMMFSRYRGCTGGPGTTDPGRYVCANATLRELIQEAWDLPSYRLVGPGTLDDPSFDIEAKVPAGTTEDRFKQMLQKLLIDRFHLAVHHETIEQDCYALTADKSGHKLQAPPPGDTESPRDALNKNANGDGTAKTIDGLPPEEAALRDALQKRRLEQKTAAGRATRVAAPPPSHIAMRSVNGVTRMAGRRATMADLARWLSGTFACPVVDRTGLAGAWNFIVGYGSTGERASPAAAALPSLQPSPANSGGSSTDPSIPTGGPSIFAAFEKQLGLKLEKAKAPGDRLVVDKVDKSPVPN